MFPHLFPSLLNNTAHSSPLSNGSNYFVLEYAYLTLILSSIIISIEKKISHRFPSQLQTIFG